MSASRIDPDTKPVLYAAASSAALIAAVSFALSAAGLVQLAAWGHVPSFLAWCVPVMIDGAIAVYTLAVLVFRARGESTTVAWVSLALWTAVSVGGNAEHGWDPPALVQRAVGTVVVALAPIAVALAVHTISDLIVARPSKATEQPRTAGDPARSSGVTTTVAPLVSVRPDALSALAARRRPAQTSVRRHRTPWTRPAQQADTDTGRTRPPGRAADHRDTIASLHADGLSVRAIAAQIGMGRTAVHEIVRTLKTQEVPA